MSDPVTQTISAYDKTTQAYATTWFHDPVMEPALDRFVSLIETPGHVLDTGCGPGRDVLFLQKRGVEAVGIDLCVGMIEEARKRVPNAVFRRMDLRSIKYPPEVFTGIWSCASFQHLPLEEAISSLREFNRVLKAKGILGISVEEGRGQGFDTLGRFHQFYSATEICNLIQDAGFQILDISSSCSSKEINGQLRTKNWLMIFARKSDSSFIDTNSTELDCFFCPESRLELPSKIGLPGPASILWGDENLYLIPDIAPLVEGHLLLITTNHYICVGACPPKLVSAIEFAQQQIRSLFQSAYSESTVFFEHGPARSRAAGSCIDHAHWHCLPISLSLRKAMDQLLKSGRAASAESLSHLYLAGESYLYLEEGNQDRYVFPVDVVPSQFFRQLVTTLTGGKDWDWQTSCRRTESKDKHVRTLARLLPLADTLLLTS
jgi:ubiquinone/menaquinone biosynthesis C-methylase UbiE/diadenosine tetraphosphate (Ap4A) HIT family hydrolase